MTIGNRFKRSIWLATVLAAAWATTGCAERHYYRVHDSYYNDNHRWDNTEIVFYSQWSVETHRDSHRDFRRLSRDEQRQYWEWRHHHGDHDHR